jgi:hypothetical protein
MEDDHFRVPVSKKAFHPPQWPVSNCPYEKNAQANRQVAAKGASVLLSLGVADDDSRALAGPTVWGHSSCDQ